ncbi:histone-lysine N-methyltransferase EZA1 isoform X1 [Ricinus communis]|uniref:[histone H3]-lysine(27) N-trimethyltransferase n=3 Tax=Ricinus communis TaxID=3988 RepID=B9RNE0_RICCO|nr:histone-lysine N-methyltransferase EZA1 isoform X1 [Ricinus communis]EEF47263.1 enhancer of zeste, ezh, putative [Ricinus communis]|eukprot:XP_002515279.1 histone-lysine N-methyltransferase EZA1 isoform X3 [Ricinus communis]
MLSKSTDSVSKLRKSHGEQSNECIGNLSYKMNLLKKQIQAERIFSIKEKVENNRKKLESDVAQIMLASSRIDALNIGQTNFSRIGSPLCKYSGFAQGSGDKDYINGHEVIPWTSTKIPFVERIPPYTTWIFLDRNQRMAEDQSVVGRRRIYYDQNGNEALICSDSEEDIAEPEEEKHDFSEGEDRILWMVFQEHGLAEEVLNIVSQFIGVPISDIQERCSMLKERFDEEQNGKDSGDSASEKGISLEKSLSAALDSFDNLFCRRCLLFDCRLHGCSQALINPSEKQPYWSEYEDDRKPCSDQCFLRLKVVRDLPESSVNCALNRMKTASLEEGKKTAGASNAQEPSGADDGADLSKDDSYISQKEISVASGTLCHSEASEASNLDTCAMIHNQEHMRKRKEPELTNVDLDDSTPVPSDLHNSSNKKQKRLLGSDAASKDIENISSLDDLAGTEKTTDTSELQITTKNTLNNPSEYASKEIVSSAIEKILDEANDATKGPELIQSSSTDRQLEGVLSRSRWKPIEKELYLKGVEIFGKNSCLIARNLLSGLKTCMEVSNYMCDSGVTVPHKSVAPSSILDDNGKTDTDYTEQEISTRSRLLRKRGRTRKLKYSWKSAGHPASWKRIADGKNQSCKQYTPCGCQSMCGKQCPCLHNGTCCEKYCGCSKSCKNRFRGCHCAKSQCRSRQCPCFAAGRECDPDVCRNCWVSCGDSSLGEPPKRGDGQCGNMRLLLRQQQRILLAKSNIAGWGAFLKNPVNKNDYLGEYTGELISHREADKRGKIYDRANSSFLFDLNEQYVLDAYRKGDKLKFANHSSNPNCYAKVMLVAGDHRVGIFAKEHIEASEELFYDYRYGPDQAPAWARKPEGSRRDESTVSQGRAKKHQSH